MGRNGWMSCVLATSKSRDAGMSSPDAPVNAMRSPSRTVTVSLDTLRAYNNRGGSLARKRKRDRLQNCLSLFLLARSWPARVAPSGRHLTLPPWARQDAPFSPGAPRLACPWRSAAQERLIADKTRPPASPKGRGILPAGDAERAPGRSAATWASGESTSGLLGGRTRSFLPPLAHFLCIHVATPTKTMEMTTNTADSAFTSGVTAVLSMP